MSSRARWHWFAPTVMTASLVASMFLALGHHLFYARLQHSLVPTEPIHVAGHSLTPQSFNTAVGTAFAFFVRMLLVTAMSTAYVQVFWYAARTASPRSTLNELDWAGSLKSNAFNLLNLRMGAHHYVLLTLAIVLWSVPVGTIFPPAALSVISVPQNASFSARVPTYEFASYKFAGRIIPASDSGEDPLWSWTGPNAQIIELAAGVMANGRIVEFEAPKAAPNSSWSTDVSIPQIQCNSVTDARRDAIYTNIWNSFSVTTDGQNPKIPRYLSWVTWDKYSVSAVEVSERQDLDEFVGSILPFIIINGSVTEQSKHTLALGGSADLFVAAMPNMQDLSVDWVVEPNSYGNGSYQHLTYHNGSDYEHFCNCSLISSTSESPNCRGSPLFPSWFFENSTLLQCGLYNASYRTEYSVTNGQQLIELVDNTDLPPTLINTTADFSGPGSYKGGNGSTYAFLWACNDSVSLPCIYSKESMNLISYQSIAAAFNSFVVGMIDNFHTANTSILTTILMYTDELSPMLAETRLTDVEISDWSTLPSLQALFDKFHNTSYMSLSKATVPRSIGPLSTALEQLFQNYTLSILGDSAFRSDDTSQSLYASPPFANVTFLLPPAAIYTYDVATLWIAYGISLAFAVIAVLVGAIALYLNGVSYSDNFSTVVRVAKTASLSVEVRDADASGNDPLPKHLRNARLDMKTGATDIRGYSAAPSDCTEEALNYDDAKGRTVVYSRTI